MNDAYLLCRCSKDAVFLLYICYWLREGEILGQENEVERQERMARKASQGRKGR